MLRSMQLLCRWDMNAAPLAMVSSFSVFRSKYADKNNNKRRIPSFLLIPTTVAVFGGTLYLGWRAYKSAHSPYIGEKCTSKIPLVSTSSPKMITPEELALHRSADDGGIWMSLEGKVYDVTNFVDLHPGGDKILLAAGADMAPFWSVYGFHYENHVKDLLKEYYIGDLTVTTPPQNELTKGDPYENEPQRHPALSTLSSVPRNAETPPELIPDHPTTPTELFFIRNHLPVPDIKPEEYKLNIRSPSLHGNHEGMQVELDLDTLKNEFSQHKLISTIICAGNRRSEMIKMESIQAKAAGRKPIIRGLSWNHSAISTAEWTGVYLRDVLIRYLSPDGKKYTDEELLEQARKAGIQHVQFVGADVDPSAGAFGASLPIDWALDPKKDVMLAFDMNGAPLTRDHGAPLRLIIPGSVGARQVKWLKEIILSDKMSSSYWFTDDYKIVTPEATTDKTHDQRIPPIMDVPLQSAICNPVDGHTIRSRGEIDVNGYAYSGGGRGIISVLVSIDGGHTWREADLEPVSPPNVVDPSNLVEGDLALEHRNSRQWAWTLWRVTIPIPDHVTELEITCCARDSSNSMQPEHGCASLNVRGLLMSAWHRIRVKVQQEYQYQADHHSEKNFTRNA